MDHKKCEDERWLVSSSAENAAKFKEEDNDDDEALSLSDLPLIHQCKKENENDDNNSGPLVRQGGEEDEFDFCSISRESEMCSADEVFYQGQILPLRRHSVSSEKGLLQHSDGRRFRSNSVSRSDSMDHHYYSLSSRSSSISSGSSSSAIKYKHKLPPRSQFHSHPSPSPRLHFPTGRSGGACSASHRNSVKKSSIWSLLRLGLVSTPPEIAFHDLKARSRNSTSSNSSWISGGASIQKLKPRFLGACRCSADAVAPRVAIIKRCASENDVVRENSEEIKPKKCVSHHRTFEWLKQLSVEGAAGGDDV